MIHTYITLEPQGAKTLRAISEALESTNDTPQYLNLDDNPLLSSDTQNIQKNDE